MIFRMKTFPLLNDRKSQFSRVKAVNIVQLEWSFCQIDSSLSLETCRQYKAFKKPRKKQKQSTCLCHAALNVDYIAWIITLLGPSKSNLTYTFIFDPNYFLWKLKTSTGKFLA